MSEQEAVVVVGKNLTRVTRTFVLRWNIYDRIVYSYKKFCKCPNSEKGIIKVDIVAHKHDCKFRKRLSSKDYVVNTYCARQSEPIDYVLGVAI